MSGGITGISLAIVCPPRPVGQWTDVSNFRQLKSRTLAKRTQTTVPGGNSARPAAFEQSEFVTPLPTGTRLVARLESAVSTAVKEPVVAVVEYNYERWNPRIHRQSPDIEWKKKMRSGASSLSASKCIERTRREHEFPLPLHFQ